MNKRLGDEKHLLLILNVTIFNKFLSNYLHLSEIKLKWIAR